MPPKRISSRVDGALRFLLDAEPDFALDSEATYAASLWACLRLAWPFGVAHALLRAVSRLISTPFPSLLNQAFTEV
jgi:hypothetical protein